MSDVSKQVFQSMFNHLVQSYDPAEAREILIQKYPGQESDILDLNDDVDMTASEEQDDEAEEVVIKTKASKPAKTAKPAKIKAVKAPKVAKPAKEKKVSKMDRARELYASATDQSRKAMIELFGKELGLSPAAASTYFYSVKG